MEKLAAVCIAVSALALPACSPKAPAQKIAACPKIEVTAQVAPSQAVTFEAKVDPAPADATFNWSIAAGTITSGQGTSSIIVEAPSGPVTATAEIGGIAEPCTKAGSATAQIP